MRHYLEAQLKSSRLHNSILIQSNDFKETLAELQTFIKHSLLGDQIALENHPDFRLVLSDRGAAILVDQIRELQEFLYKTASIAPFKVAIIAAADLMNANAANSCLKILEDTPKNTHIFLIANNITNILPTIRSRCIKIRHAVQDIRDKDEALYEKHIKTAAGFDEKAKLDFLQELSGKNKELWLGFARDVDFLITKLVKKAAGINVNLSSVEEEIIHRFGGISVGELLTKSKNIDKIIKNTVKYDLDLRANFILIVAEFESNLR